MNKQYTINEKLQRERKIRKAKRMVGGLVGFLVGAGLFFELAFPWAAKKATQEVYQESIKYASNPNDPNRMQESVALEEAIKQLKGDGNFVIRALYKGAPMYRNYVNEIQDNWLGFSTPSNQYDEIGDIIRKIQKQKGK